MNHTFFGKEFNMEAFFLPNFSSGVHNKKKFVLLVSFPLNFLLSVKQYGKKVRYFPGVYNTIIYAYQKLKKKTIIF